MQSFKDEELTVYNGQRVCPSCLEIAKKPPVTRTHTVQTDAKPPSPIPQVAAESEPTSIVGWLVQDAREWCRGRIWWIRVPVLLYFAYVLFRDLRNPLNRTLLDGINLGIHEAGHYVFWPLGKFMMLAGGTILQCLAPVIAAIVFARQKDYFGISFCIGWLSVNLFNVATYVADARAQALPLVSPESGTPIHDWHYMLGQLHLLSLDTAIAWSIRVGATGLMLVCFAMGIWLLWQMARLPVSKDVSMKL
jgi:hypothetical protein